MALDTDNFFSIKVIRFYLKLIGFWYAETERDEWIQFILRINTIAAVIFTVFVQGVDLYHSWGNFEELTYNACVTLPILLNCLKVINFISRRDALIDIIIYTEKIFLNKTYDEFGGKIMRECEKQTFMLLLILTITVEGTVWSYVIESIYDNIGKNGTERTLPFRIWTNFPVTKTPYYEIIFIVETLSGSSTALCYFVFDSLLYTLNIHAIGQFKILRNRLENLCEEYINNGTGEGEPESDYIYTIDFSYDFSDMTPLLRRKFVEEKQSEMCEETYEKLKECIKHHLVLIEYVQKLEHVFNIVLLCEVGISSICICFSGFQIFIAKQVRYIFHFMSTFVEMFILTCTCNEIIVQSSSVGDSAYRSRWYMMPTTKDGRSIRHAITFVMVRSQHPCFLTGGKFTRMSLDIFTAIMSTTLSYLSLLRQVSEG